MTQGKSLHIGVNVVDPDHYRGWSGPLKGCENDATAMHALASGEGFDATLMLTAAATRASVSEHISNAASELGDGDFFFLTYAGHGGQVKDVDGDEDDQKDETWCLYDGQLLDDELSVLWAGFDKGVRILLLSDSCHSGSVSKGGAIVDDVEDPEEEGVAYRYMPRDAAVETYRKNRGFYSEIQLDLPDPRPTISATVRLISGCQDHQRSSEKDGNGLFTRALTTLWSDGSFDGAYKELHDALCASLPDKQQPNHLVIGSANPDYDRQRPFLIG